MRLKGFCDIQISDPSRAGGMKDGPWNGTATSAGGFGH